MPTKVKEFNDYRQEMNDKILATDNKVIASNDVRNLASEAKKLHQF